jgi:lysosomal Pro-X carboxypeptidase
MCSNITGSLNVTASQADEIDPIDLLRAVYNGVNVYQNYTGQTRCLDIGSDVDANTVDMVAWTYQTCTEFVFPMCSNGKNDMFQPAKWDPRANSLACFNQFQTAPRAEWPSIGYGVSVADFKSFSNIIFSNGGFYFNQYFKAIK